MAYSVTNKANFKVEIDGVDYGNFISVTGLGATSEVITDIGGMDKTGRKINSKINYETVVLTRNSDPRDKVLKDWWKSVESGDPERKSVAVVLYDRDGTTEIGRRNLYECLPCGWDMSDLNSNENGLITESLSLVYETADWG